MEVILLERIARLGQMGDVVRVRDGHARNYLLPQGKALRANEANGKRFESERARLETRNLERRQEAAAVGGKIEGQSFVVVRQAGETGQLYGSVTARDLAEIMDTDGFAVARGQIALNHPIKTIGMHPVQIDLHADVAATVMVNVARSEDEASRQARGEDVTRMGDQEDEDHTAVAAKKSADEAAEDSADEPTSNSEDAAGSDIDATKTDEAG